MRLGDLDALKEIFLQDRCGNIFLPKHFVISTIDNAPTVEVDKEFIDKIRATGNFKNGYQLAKNYYKRPQGEWLKYGDHAWKCSKCNCSIYVRTRNFCPDCGADMRGDKE